MTFILSHLPIMVLYHNFPSRCLTVYDLFKAFQARREQAHRAHLRTGGARFGALCAVRDLYLQLSGRDRRARPRLAW